MGRDELRIIGYYPAFVTGEKKEKPTPLRRCNGVGGSDQWLLFFSLFVVCFCRLLGFLI